ncbi:MAG: GNAT family N-acetyltransferase [Anaerolineae bacterium]|nr:GNAT family N-acetyltransferase [Anaerolineae bacterium]
MRPEDRTRFPPVPVSLKDGREAVLRLLETGDAEALADFYGALPRETWRFYCPPRLTSIDAAKKAARALDSRLVCVVAEDATTNQIIGYDWYTWKDEASRASVFGICLRESHRGAGLGHALMEQLLRIAREVGPPVMSLTVQLANPRAIALYTKMGFRIVRQQVRKAVGYFPAEPEYYMEREAR